MNKNKKLNLIFYIISGCYLVVATLNAFLKFTSFDFMFSLCCFLVSVYLFLKFLAYNSDSSLFLSCFLLFTSVVYYICYFENFNLFQTITLVLLCIVLSYFVLFVQYKSSYCLYAFVTGLLLFFPIIFFSFNIITINYFFIFLFSCVIINALLYFLFFKFK